MSKSMYSTMLDELSNKIKSGSKDGKKASCSYSKSDLENLTLALLNSPEHVVTEYQMKVSEADGSPVTIDKMPSKRYRESLKPMLRTLGLDKNDAEKVSDIQFTKEHSSALIGVATCAIKDYLRAGRKFSFPITAPDECRMEFYCDTAPERINQNRFAKTEEEKSKISKTLERKILKTKNLAPAWLRVTEK